MLDGWDASRLERKPVKVAFSTLGCPSWSLAHACAQAKAYGYDGLEIRLIDGRVVSADIDAAERDRVRDVLAAGGVAVSALGTSVKLAAPDAEQSVTELRAGLELAAAWSIPTVRVFGGRVGDNEDRASATRRGASVVAAVLDDARRLGMRVALETHDDYSAAGHVAAMLETVGDPAFGVIWDIQHTWRAGDQPADAWSALGAYAIEIHVKDGRETGDGWQQTDLGAGELPVGDCLARAAADGFDGWLVVEWEKHWHPELAEPEEALPAHRAALGELMAELA